MTSCCCCCRIKFLGLIPSSFLSKLHCEFLSLFIYSGNLQIHRAAIMTAMDDHWPSLPPIRTSSHNSRVSCETLNINTSPPASSSNPHSSYNTPFSQPPSSSSSSQTAKPADASSSIRASSASTPSRFFSHCLPCRFASPKAAVSAATSPGKEGKRAAGGAFDSGGLLRSIVGFPAGAIPRYTSPMAPFSTGIPPSNTISPSGRMKMVASVGTISPSGRMKPGATTPHSGMQMSRGSKGHAANAFTMMPPDVVGKKKPPGYESDEPTSPEVTCMGRVRRKKHRKTTWCALVKDEEKNHGRNKGRVKKLAAEVPRKSDFIQAVKKNEEDESTMAAKLSKQRSGRRKSHEFEGLQNEWGVEKLNQGQEKLNDSDLRTDRHNIVEGFDKKLAMVESLHEGSDQRGSMDVENVIVEPCYGNDAGGHESNDHNQSSCRTAAADSEWQDGDSTSEKPSLQQDEKPSCQHHEELGNDVAFVCDTTEATGACVHQTEQPPPNCLLLMRKGSSRRSERRSCDDLLASSVYEHAGHTSNHWNWGQVLT